MSLVFRPHLAGGCHSFTVTHLFIQQTLIKHLLGVGPCNKYTEYIHLTYKQNRGGPALRLLIVQTWLTFCVG